ncbi:MAG TPA: tetratricopeptide repeat protein, partial [Planctomycetia bacterium]|nr:tetratricopeptide repeat protein [Planctomycetia bacterium]
MPLRRAIPIFLLAAFAVYFPALRGEMIWDDADIYLRDNPLLAAPDGWWRFWLTADAPDYYPLAYTTFWLEYRLWGIQTAGYHVDNVLLHAAAAVFLLRTLERLRIPGAFATALLFIVHPVAVESVAWISQRKTVLAGALLFASTAAWTSYAAAGSKRSYTAAVVAFALSLASKPIGIGLPFLLLFDARWRLGRSWRQAAGATLPFFAIALVLGAVGTWFQSINVLGPIRVRDENLLERTITAAHAIGFYAASAWFPFRTCFEYPRETAEGLGWRALVSIALPLGLALLAWRSRYAGGGFVLGCLAAFVVMLGPALGFVDVYYWRYSLVGDHYQYAALPAALALVVGPVAAEIARRGWKPAGALAGLAIALLFGTFAHRDARQYRDEATLWTSTLERNLSAWLARTRMSRILREWGDLRTAHGLTRQAYELRPDLEESQINFGQLLADQGDWKGAAAAFEWATLINPENSLAWHDLGMMQLQLGRYVAALESLQAADERTVRHTRKGPASILSISERARLLSRLGRANEAIAAYRLALERRPGDAGAAVGIGFALLNADRRQDAEAEFRAVLAARPELALARTGLAVALDRQGRYVEA